MDADRKMQRTGKGSRTRPIVVCEPELVPITGDDERRALHADPEVTRDGIWERFGQLRLPGPDVAGEDHQRRAVHDLGDDREDPLLVLGAPSLEHGRVQQRLGLPDQPGLDAVDADQCLEPPLGIRIRVLEHAPEQAGGRFLPLQQNGSGP